MKFMFFLTALTITAGLPIFSQDYSKSIFEGNSDVGACKIPGSLTFSGDKQEYVMAGPGGETEERKSATTAPDVIQLERRGDRFIFSCAHAGEPFDAVAVSDPLTAKELFAGIFICSHDNNVLEQARFFNRS